MYRFLAITVMAMLLGLLGGCRRSTQAPAGPRASDESAEPASAPAERAVGTGTVVVLGKGASLFEVFDEAGKNKLGFASTGRPLAVPAGPCVVALNGIRKQVTVKPGEQTELETGVLRVTGIGQDLYEVYDAAGTNKLNFTRTNTEMELFAESYVVRLNNSSRNMSIRAGEETIVEAGSVIVEGHGGALYEVYDEKGTKKLGFTRIGTAMELFPGTYTVVHLASKHSVAVQAKRQTIAAGPPASAPAVEEGFVSLFDGKSLNGWQGRVDDYEAADGILICKKGAEGSLYTDRQYADFVLRLQYRLEAGGNNGIGIRAAVSEDPPAATGMEIQILDDSYPEYQSFEPVQYNGSIYGAVAATRGHDKPVGEWNDMEITAKGSRIQVVLNGTRIVDVDMDTIGPIRMHGFDFVGLHNKTGRIAICGHQHRIEFRNIRVKELP